mmetsp:Transcript_60747/g.111332  ORF Transcript_60747/g.111332 Transcript_60747/m.111332 type:complete len:446 (+) Transcript_60747:56-1393(+)
MVTNPFGPYSEKIPDRWMTLMFGSQFVSLFLIPIMVYSDGKLSKEKQCKQNSDHQKGQTKDIVSTKSLDGLRGLASLIVGIYHLLAYVQSPVNVSGQVAIPVFYVISGFALELRYGKSFASGSIKFNTFVRYIVRRFAKLYPAFFVLNVLSIPNFARHSEINLFMIPSFLLISQWVPSRRQFLPPLFASWTNSVLFFLYITFPFLTYGLGVLNKKQAGQYSKSSVQLLAIVASLVYFLGGWIASVHGWQDAYYNSGPFAVPCFLAGCCAGHERMQQSCSKSSEVIQDFSQGHCKSECSMSDAFLAIILTLCLTPILSPKNALVASFAAQLPVYACILALTRPCAKPGFIDSWILCSPAMQFMSEISMCFYLLVPFLQDYVLWVHGGSSVMCALHVLVFILAFPAAWIFTRFFEKPFYFAIVKWIDKVMEGLEKPFCADAPYHLLS